MSLRHCYKVSLRAVIYAAIRPAIECFRLAPPEVAAAAGRWGGRLAGAVMWRARGKMEANLRRAFPDSDPTERRRMARAHFEHLGRTLGEFLSLTRRDPERLRGIVSVEGMEHVERPVREGRGVVVLTSHLGSWEIAAATFAQRFPSLAVVARDLYDRRLSRLAARLRAHFGVRTLDTGDARGILRHLKSGGVLGVLVDLSTWRVANARTRFFGGEVAAPVGPIHIAERAGAALVMGFGSWTGRRHRMVVESLADRPDGVPPAECMESFNRRLEHHIRQHPEQWVWLHDRWARSEFLVKGTGG